MNSSLEIMSPLRGLSMFSNVFYNNVTPSGLTRFLKSMAFPYPPSPTHKSTLQGGMVRHAHHIHRGEYEISLSNLFH